MKALFESKWVINYLNVTGGLRMRSRSLLVKTDSFLCRPYISNHTTFIIMPTLNPLNLMKVLIFLLLSSLAVYALPGDKKDGSTSPTTAPGKLLKLALEKAEALRQEKANYQKEEQEFKVQKEDTLRHDREWARQRKSNKDKQSN